MGRRKFEDAFKDAFQDAELTPAEKVWSKVERDLDKTSGDFKVAFLDAELVPTDNVWTNVELDLERAAGAKMRRRLLFYKMLAAASVAFAMCMAGVGYYSYNMRDEGFLAQNVNEAGQLNDGTPSSVDPAANNLAGVEDSKGQKSKDAIIEGATGGSQQASSEANVPVASEANGVASGSSQTKSSLLSNGALADNTSADSKTSASISKDNIAKASTSTQSSLTKKDPANETAVIPSGDNIASESSTQPSMATTTTSSVAVLNQADGQSTKSTIGNISESASVENRASNATAVSNGTSNDTKNTSGVAIASAEVPANNANTLASAKDKPVQDRYILTSQQRPLSSQIVVANAKVPEKPQSNADPFKLMMLRLEDEAMAINTKAKKDKKNARNEQLWTSVGMTAGTYNTVNRSISNEMASSAVRSATSQAKASGLAYSFGVSVGTKVSERWVVQGGVNYLNQLSDYTSNIIVNNGGAGYNALTASNASALKDATLETRRDDASMQFAQTPLFGISSTMEFISIPVEAGYLVMNKKVGVMLNAGVSTDLFIQNTESANVSGAAKAVQTQERGSSDSPYRDVNFIGLVGTEVSYKIGQRYRVALRPGLRYPFNSMYKSESQIQATPITFDVGLKFRYIFQ